MNNFTNWLLAFTAAALLAVAGCAKEKDAPAPATASPKDARTAVPREHANEKAQGHGEEGEEAHGEAEGAHEESGPVQMDEAAMKSAGIRVATLQPTALSEELRAPGEVVESAYGTSLITPRVASLVVRRHVRLGDEVRAGQALVTLSSVEVSDAQAELRIAEQEWKRVSALGREAVAGRRITEAKVALDRARATANAYGLAGDSARATNGEFTLTAPHDGRITEDDFVVGERIEPGKALYRLVDESIVWVDAKLPPGTVARIAPGSAATIVVGEQRIAGTVLRSAHRTSESTRSAAIRVEVPNPDDRLHGGDFVEVYFEAASQSTGTTPGDTISVPTGAVVQLDGEAVVFQRKQDGLFEPISVRTGAVIGDRTVIREGLSAGDVVVIEGAFALKSQILKSQLGDDHD